MTFTQSLLIPIAMVAGGSGGIDAARAEVYTESQAALQACMDHATTNVDFSQCYSDAIAIADAKLNATWREVMTLLSDQPEAQKSLRAEQRKWIAFKEESCRFYWDEGFGSMHRSIIGPQCRLDVIETRTLQLLDVAANLKPDY